MNHDERADRPGSHGEHLVQRELSTVARADRFYEEQVLRRLNPRMREFVAQQEMFFLATADADGECDSTFRAGPPGFLRVLDDATLAYPEYRGNGVMASLGNIRENPRVGILVIDFARDRIGLHINGRAQLVPDERMRVACPDLPVDPVPGRRPQVWVTVEVEEAYIHCSKHIPRLVRAPLRASGVAAGGERAWGTDDARRKGGDYFGAAAQVRSGDRGVYRRLDRAMGVTGSVRRLRAADPEVWQQEARRALTEARQRGAVGQPSPEPEFRGWFAADRVGGA